LPEGSLRKFFPDILILILIERGSLEMRLRRWELEIKGDRSSREMDHGMRTAKLTNPTNQKTPSRDPRIGRYSKNLKFYVKIHGESSPILSSPSIHRSILIFFFFFQCIGSCKPAERVSKEWCFRQFYNICRNGNKNGSGIGKYGGGGCQRWMILEKGNYMPT
jgi:hypothetical protein